MKSLVLSAALACVFASHVAYASPPSEGTLYSGSTGTPDWICHTEEAMTRLVASLSGNTADMTAVAEREKCTIASIRGVLVGNSIDFQIISTTQNTREHIWAFWIISRAGNVLVLHEEVLYDPPAFTNVPGSPT
jgi:hypothetical protein